MLTSLALIFLVGLAAASICQRIRLPRIIGMLATGILLGPYVLDFLDDSILSISSDLREMALVIILIKAGLSLDISELKEVGRPAVLMAFLPAVLKSWLLSCWRQGSLASLYWKPPSWAQCWEQFPRPWSCPKWCN